MENQLQMVKMVAEQVMRPHSRYYDEHEHDVPQGIRGDDVAHRARAEQGRLRTRPAQSGRANGGSSGPPRPRKSVLRMILLIEMLSWGDAGQYLCTPVPALGGAAVEAIGTPEQKARFLKKFGEGTPKWGAMAITEAGAGSDNSSMRTTAVLDPETNEWVLNGEKIFITNGRALSAGVGRFLRRLGHGRSQAPVGPGSNPSSSKARPPG